MRRLPEPKATIYLFGADETIRQWPETVQDKVADALALASLGGKHPLVRPMPELAGLDLFQIAVKFDGKAYRMTYTVRFKQANLVVYAWIKKSPRDRLTPPNSLKTIERRARRAIEQFEEKR